MAKANLYPSKITQPNAHDKIAISKWCFKEVRRGGGVYNYGCSSPNDPRYYHEWSNVDELKSGKTAQCGRPSTSSCSHSTSHGIAGYRNTCPIAGCNGTYNTPATLRLHFSASDLQSKGMQSGATIKSITVSFEHRCTGVDVSNGKESTSWGPNFNGYKQYPNLNVLKLFFTNKNGTQISKTVTKDSNGHEFSNPPLSKKFGTVTAKFTDVTFNELKGGALNIVYGRNLSTNPGNIYIKGAKIHIEYTNPPKPPSEPTLKVETTGNHVFTSLDYNCRSYVTHKITALKPNGQPYSKDDILVFSSSSDIFVYDSDQTDGNKILFDVSGYGADGDRSITYKIKNTSKAVTVGFTFEFIQRPKMSIKSSIKQYSNATDFSGSSIKFYDGCASRIFIYADGFTSNHLIKEITSNDVCLNCQDSNLLKESVAQDIMKSISELPCGKHTIYYRFNDGSNAVQKQHRIVEVLPREYKFKMSIGTENEQEFNLIQDKDSPEVNIKIQRIDDENPSIAPKFSIQENTLLRHRRPHSHKTDPIEITNNVVNIPVSRYLPGKFFILIKEVNLDNRGACQLSQDRRTINITPNHRQYHDSLFIRGEDSTSFDYDYVVAWEGDDIKQPIDVDDIELICSYDDIKLCVDKDTSAGLSQTKTARIRVFNNSINELDFKNINLELNVLKQDNYGDLVVTTDEYFDLGGMLLNFEENFKMYNKDIADNVSIKNLSPDDDLEDEENVYINIKELKYGDSITINIPFSCRSAKDIYCQLLIFGQPMQLHLFDDCNSMAFDYMHLNTYDSIQTDMQIIGETDLLKPNIDYDLLTGEEANQCPNECFNTKTNQNQPLKIDDNNYNGGITYKIKNIDSNNISYAKTIISNDINLNPVGLVYYQNNAPTLLMFDSNYTQDSSNKIILEQTETTKVFNIINGIVRLYVNFPSTDEEQVYIQRTNKNGEVQFSFTIPESDNKYTLDELLEDVITIYYEGNDDNQSIIVGTTCDSVNQIEIQHEQENTKKIQELTRIKESLPQNSSQALIIQNTIAKLATINKNPTTLTPINTYRKYKPGQTINLTVQLKVTIKHMKNQIVFYPEILYAGQEDAITVFYEMCNLENNQKILNTTFKTDTYTMIPNEVSKNIYCGIETKLYSKTRIEKRVVEQNTLNVIHIYLYNEVRDNHDVVCRIDLGPYPTQNLDGIYDFINMSIDDGEYNINISENNHVFIEWNVGEMKVDSQTKGMIILKGKEIGLSEILVDTFDYQHHEGQSETYNFGEYECSCRNDE